MLLLPLWLACAPSAPPPPPPDVRFARGGLVVQGIDLPGRELSEQRVWQEQDWRPDETLTLGTYVLRTPDTPACVRIAEVPLETAGREPHAPLLRIDPTGTRLAVVDPAGTLHVVDAWTGTRTWSKPGETFHIGDLAWGPSGATLAIAIRHPLPSIESFAADRAERRWSTALPTDARFSSWQLTHLSLRTDDEAVIVGAPDGADGVHSPPHVLRVSASGPSPLSETADTWEISGVAAHGERLALRTLQLTAAGLAMRDADTTPSLDNGGLASSLEVNAERVLATDDVLHMAFDVDGQLRTLHPSDAPVSGAHPVAAHPHPEGLVSVWQAPDASWLVIGGDAPRHIRVVPPLVDPILSSDGTKVVSRPAQQVARLWISGDAPPRDDCPTPEDVIAAEVAPDGRVFGVTRGSASRPPSLFIWR